VVEELRQRVGDKRRIEKSGFAERSSSREIGLHNNGSNMK
jgi:hypothetical protein